MSASYVGNSLLFSVLSSVMKFFLNFFLTQERTCICGMTQLAPCFVLKTNNNPLSSRHGTIT